MSLAPREMAARIGSGLLSFPATHFDDQLAFDELAFRAHCAHLLEHDIAGLFAAGGTGEFFSLTPAEAEAVARAAVDEARGRLPVIAGCGYGTTMAVELARGLERAGADGILLLPPYLVRPSQQGLAAHVDSVCRATGLGVIIYNRDNAVLEAETLEQLCERNPNLVGFKDGLGDIELMTRIRVRLADRLTYICGLPTAETFVLPYLAMGVTTYSSAIFNFLPAWALQFYRAVQDGDGAFFERELAEFVLPYVALRSRSPGYAVSIVKAGMAIMGSPAGRVRPPLSDLRDDELNELRAIIANRH